MMNTRDGILLYCLKQFNGERSLSGILHLVKGKKTSQTLSDGHLFNLSFLFGVLPSFEREEFEKTISHLIERSLAKRLEDRYIITEEGDEQLAKLLKDRPYLFAFNGLRYRNAELPFYRLLALYIQALSHSTRNNYDFLPVSRDPVTLYLVKRIFPKQNERQAEADQLYREFLSLLGELPGRHAEIFVLKLSRYGRTGLTNNQAASVLGLPVEDTELIFRSVLHYLLMHAEEGQKFYPVLNKLVNCLEINDPLTVSAQKTWRLLRSGNSMEQIIMIRKMKKSTIEDHLVEIAIHYPNFSVEPYVTEQEQEKIIAAFEKLQTKKLKRIKESLGDDISYFKIRLVLGRAGDRIGAGSPVK
ncbi:helix-turn-helix domain-containing protein [Fictibacillus sp. KU28468]|uniref:helix-turn-helix domain-containing protein n=1 Tax=Fictibacillus sp. KU28468 TaxID=2991053 RepID=UPI00223CFD9C|nr:helix-turn-helix domain-containing protein [Fictibacillus sp. KU28468]UZJ80795.1 helix-turn-helix domain-containing protein [Fictibacillus sp. KU28468]